MRRQGWPLGPPHNFAGLAEEFASLERAGAVVLPVPYDFTTTYQAGARWGPRAILAASQNMELWDEEIGPVYRSGIHTLREVEPTADGPASMVERIETATAWIAGQDKLPVVLGGEHSITAGAVRALVRLFPKLSVLQIDAHADMRNTYLGSPYSHACVMRRVREMVPAASVGVRSLSEEEAEYLERHPLPIWSPRQLRGLGGRWEPILSSLTDQVFITFDLDGLDPSIMPSTGTPEPGGLDWYEAADLLRAVSERVQIVGFDVVELAPLPGQVAPDYLAARLTYRLIGLALSRRLAAARSGAPGRDHA
ncbi:MAG TPA: agmatinase [Candidatus Eisenbacteria bacterium]|jgi:agmatinase